MLRPGIRRFRPLESDSEDEPEVNELGDGAAPEIEVEPAVEVQQPEILAPPAAQEQNHQIQVEVHQGRTFKDYSEVAILPN